VRSLQDGAEARFGRAVTVQVTRLRGKLAVGEHVFSGRVEITTADAVFTLDGTRYRGRLQLIPMPDPAAYRAVNTVGLESYLAGVVGAEMPAYWDAPALQAQAVASRTYALYHMQTYGPGRDYDVRRTEGYQVYGGIDAETPSIWLAVNATHGRVLVDDSAGHQSRVFPAYFCSTCGGHTEPAANVFTANGTALEQVSALRGATCPWCRRTSRPEWFAWPPVRIEIDDAYKRLLERYPRLERLQGLATIEATQVSRYDDFSRVIRVDLVGTNGRRQWLEAENLRLALDPTGRRLRSCAFTIRQDGSTLVFENGRGFGHGVGLCQYGALGMARAGKTAADILAWYYPGARQRRVYGMAENGIPENGTSEQ